MGHTSTTSSVTRAWKARLQEALAEAQGDRSAGTWTTHVGFYALATLGAAPRVRHVVHRGFVQDSTTLVTTTDVRAPKAHEIHAHPAVELAWWIAPAKLQVRRSLMQFRIAGQASIVPHAAHAWRAATSEPAWDAERARVWHALSPGLQDTFRGAPPGTPLAEAASAASPEEDASRIPTRYDGR